ncbi:hypothetical protein [Endozoicomonas sp. ALB115]|uniref:hypothetical protein n=1 Tax=Endozoicomonas sp. ALB115 TaxID=3403074 RepID=UPI003BB4D895
MQTNNGESFEEYCERGIKEGWLEFAVRKTKKSLSHPWSSTCLAMKKFNRHVQSAKYRGHESLLSSTCYLYLMYDAGITPDDIGTDIGKYQLGRFGDSGCYNMLNCRFITKLENLKERKTTEYAKSPKTVETRLKMSEAAKKRWAANKQ